LTSSYGLMESLLPSIMYGSEGFESASTEGWVLKHIGLDIVDYSQTIESVEQEVERLLDEDSLATEVKYGKQLTVYMI